MFLKPLSETVLQTEVLRTDKKKCKRFGPCGVGQEAVYLNSFYMERVYYVPFSSIKRVFKRVAMSKGGFTGKGIFASMPYLVVIYDNGTEKQCIFKHEEDVDAILSYIGSMHPEIPLLSEAVEKKRAEQAALEEKKRRETILSEQAEKEIKKLEKARAFLEKNPDVSLILGADRGAVNDETFAELANRSSFIEIFPFKCIGSILFI